jgi:hypothetical protein
MALSKFAAWSSGTRLIGEHNRVAEIQTAMKPKVVDIRHKQQRSAAGLPTKCTRLSSTFLTPLLQPAVVAKWPQRPDPSIISNAIPLFFIARNRDGLWVAREAEGCNGGIFVFRRSAHRFANREAGVGGCATMYLGDIFELDIENRGNPCAILMGAVKTKITAMKDFFPIALFAYAALIALITYTAFMK